MLLDKVRGTCGAFTRQLEPSIYLDTNRFRFRGTVMKEGIIEEIREEAVANHHSIARTPWFGEEGETKKSPSVATTTFLRIGQWRLGPCRSSARTSVIPRMKQHPLVEFRHAHKLR